MEKRRQSSVGSTSSASSNNPPSSSSSSGQSQSKPNGNVNKSGVKIIAPLERVKIISMGSGGCGKSCLIKRYCEDRFVSKYIATIGVDYGVKPVKIDGNDVRVNFWDLSGHQEFFEIRNEFYKDAQGCVLVYDVNARESFEECDAWLAECSKFGANPREMPIVLCGNKSDKGKRQISEDEGRGFAASRGLYYFDTSAANGQNVVDMFDHLFQLVYKKIKS
jgi:DnaJ family protein C protein 27